MKTKLQTILCFCLLTSAFCLRTSAQGTAFTYQGRLNDGANPANGAYDLTFTLFNASSGGAGLGATNVFDDLLISNGLFTVTLDYGAQFDGNARWLQIAVRPGASTGAYTDVTPRQALSPAPYAVTAGTVPDGAITSAKIDSTTVQRRVTGSAPGGSFITGINQDGTVTTGVDSGGGIWSLNGADTYYNGGKVGIGTSTPARKLTLFTSGQGFEHTDGNVSFRTILGVDYAGLGTFSNHELIFYVNGIARMELTPTQGILMQSPVTIGSANPFLRFTVGGSGAYNFQSAAAIALQNTTASRIWEWHALDDGKMQLADYTAAATRLVIDTAGNVGIGTASPGFLLEVNGSAGKPGGGSWSVASDERLKKNIRPLAGALDKLLALHGVNFEYVDPAKIHELSGERMGLLAQEVEKVFPDWVETAADGYKRVTVRGLEALVVEALRQLRLEQSEKIASIEQEKNVEIEALKQRLEKLERLMSEKNGGVK